MLLEKISLERHLSAAPNFSIFLPRKIKCPGNYMKIHLASAFPRHCFCRGWQDFILGALAIKKTLKEKFM